jgi:hypothetical protein
MSEKDTARQKKRKRKRRRELSEASTREYRERLTIALLTEDWRLARRERKMEERIIKREHPKDYIR